MLENCYKKGQALKDYESCVAPLQARAHTCTLRSPQRIPTHAHARTNARAPTHTHTYLNEEDQGHGTTISCDAIGGRTGREHERAGGRGEEGGRGD